MERGITVSTAKMMFNHEWNQNKKILVEINGVKYFVKSLKGGKDFIAMVLCENFENNS